MTEKKSVHSHSMLSLCTLFSKRSNIIHTVSDYILTIRNAKTRSMGGFYVWRRGESNPCIESDTPTPLTSA